MADVQNPLDASRAGWDRSEYGDGRFESGFFGANRPAWHGLGTVIPDDVVEASRAIELADLDWPVWTAPVYAHIGGDMNIAQVPVPGQVAVGRTKDGVDEVWTCVGSGWTPVQNREAFTMMDNLVGTNKAKYHTVGSLRRGRRVWLLAKIPVGVTIAGLDEELVDLFLLLSNAHDGTGALRIDVTPVRVVCENTQNLAIAGALRTWSTRHTANIQGRVAEARKALDLATKYATRLEEVGAAMLAMKLDRRGYSRFLRSLVPTEVGMDDGGRAAKNREEARAAIALVYDTSPDLENIRGTKWGALQSVTAYSDHHRATRDGKIMAAAERRFYRNTHEPALKNRALRLLAPELAATRGEHLQLVRAR